MIGFDIVDLEISERSKNQKNPRFLDKIFTPKERAEFQSFLSNPTHLWLIWAMKESAFKATPDYLQTSFNALKYTLKAIVKRDGQWQGVITHSTQDYHCVCEMVDQLICCTSVKNATYLSKTQTEIWTVESQNIDDIRKEMQEKIGGFLKDQQLDHYHLEYLPSGRPVLADAKFSNEIISISHHGRYAGFSYLHL